MPTIWDESRAKRSVFGRVRSWLREEWAAVHLFWPIYFGPPTEVRGQPRSLRRRAAAESLFEEPPKVYPPNRVNAYVVPFVNLTPCASWDFILALCRTTLKWGEALSPWPITYLSFLRPLVLTKSFRLFAANSKQFKSRLFSSNFSCKIYLSYVSIFNNQRCFCFWNFYNLIWNIYF